MGGERYSLMRCSGAESAPSRRHSDADAEAVVILHECEPRPLCRALPSINQ